MQSVELSCSHLFYYEHVAPDDLTYCLRCREYRLPNYAVAKVKHKKPPPPPKIPSPASGKTVYQGGRSHMKPDVKAKALARTYELFDAGHDVKSIAEEIGVHQNTIKNWLAQR